MRTLRSLVELRSKRLYNSGALDGRYPDFEEIRSVEPVRDKGRVDQPGEGDVQEDAERFPERWPRQSELGGHDTAGRLFPARAVRHHREQACDEPFGGRWRHAAGQGHCRTI